MQLYLLYTLFFGIQNNPYIMKKIDTPTLITQEYDGVRWEMTYQWEADSVLTYKYFRTSKNILFTTKFSVDKNGYILSYRSLSSPGAVATVKYDQNKNLLESQPGQEIFYKNQNIDSIYTLIGVGWHSIKINRINDTIKSIVNFDKESLSADISKDSVSYSYATNMIFATRPGDSKVDTAIFENGKLLRISGGGVSGNRLFSFYYPTTSLNAKTKNYRRSKSTLEWSVLGTRAKRLYKSSIK